MTLSGNLGFVPLDEVLRLLRRSDQHGCVDVRGNAIHGRVFMGGGGIDIATTYDDDELHRHLVNSGYTEEGVLHRISTGETTLAAVAESNQGIVDLIREMTVESLYQMSVHGDEFYVHEGASTQYGSPKSFDLEALLRDATERGKEWKKVIEVIPDLNRPITFRRDLGERDEVTVKEDDWLVLGQIGTRASVSEIAESLGTTEFWTARIAARLTKIDLVEMASSEGERDEIASFEGERDEMREDDVFTEPAAPVVEEDLPSEYDTVPEDQAVAKEVDPNESWWKAPDPEEEAATDSETAEDGTVDETAATSEQDEPLSAEVESSPGEDQAEVDEDTETFLEKVFSELESSESESDEGHGLLRRRRMGTLRDFSSDS